MEILQATPLPTGQNAPIRRFSNVTFPLTGQTPIIPIVGDPSAILGSRLLLGKLTVGSIDWAPFLSRTAPPAPGTLPPAASSAPAAGAPAPNPPKEPPVGGFAVASGAWSVLQLSHTTTHAEVAEKLVTVGVAPGPAGSWADTIVGVANSHGVQSIVIGVVAGGLVVFAVEKIRPRTPPATKYAIGIVTALVTAGLFYFLAPDNSPLIGKWVLNVIESRYSDNNPPRGQVLVFSADKSGLTVSDSIVMPDGKPDRRDYHLDLDGRDHPAPAPLAALANDADTIRTTAAGNKVTTTFLKNGKAVGSEERLVSNDRKQLTITFSRATGAGEVRDVRSYERK